jgi:hypothetical protein
MPVLSISCLRRPAVTKDYFPSVTNHGKDFIWVFLLPPTRRRLIGGERCDGYSPFVNLSPLGTGKSDYPHSRLSQWPNGRRHGQVGHHFSASPLDEGARQHETPPAIGGQPAGNAPTGTAAGVALPRSGTLGKGSPYRPRTWQLREEVLDIMYPSGVGSTRPTEVGSGW